jgi:hypothetical protein
LYGPIKVQSEQRVSKKIFEVSNEEQKSMEQNQSSRRNEAQDPNGSKKA